MNSLKGGIQGKLQNVEISSDKSKNDQLPQHKKEVTKPFLQILWAKIRKD